MKMLGHMRVTELLLASGVRVHMQPMSSYQRTGLTQAAERHYPYPDADSLSYQSEKARADKLRQEYVTVAVLSLAADYPDFPDGRDELIGHFAGRIEKQRAVMSLPEDAWEATLLFGVIASTGDEMQIMLAVRDELALAPVPEEAVDRRIFHPAIPWEKYRAAVLLLNKQ